MSGGVVYLVGAGPGDPRLLTLRGAEVLQRADVVVHDRLAPAALLDLAPRGAERVDAGKARGRAAISQDGINRLLIDRARRGLSVVRLKGGDPFVFGRGGEEALALAAAGVPFEVVREARHDAVVHDDDVLDGRHGVDELPEQRQHEVPCAGVLLRR